MWRSIATLIGSVFDRPDPGDVPYGTQWHASDTGATFVTDETRWHQVSGLGAGGTVGPWIANSLHYDMLYEDLTLLDGMRIALPACAEVNVDCVVASLTETLTYGQVAVQLTVNGIERGDPVVVQPGDFCAAGAPGVYVRECDVIGFTVSTSSDLEHPGEDLHLTVMARFGSPTPPQAVEAFVRHGIVLGHQVEGTLPVEPADDFFARYRASELALSDSDPVATWPDEGSGGNDLEQATAESQPTFEAAGFNGHPSVLFDGVDDFMQTALYSAALSQPVSVIFMGEYVTTGGTQNVFDGNSTTRHALAHSGTGDWVMNSGHNESADDGPDGRAGEGLCIVAIFDAASSELRVNDGTDLMPADPGSTDRERLTLAANFLGGSTGHIRVVELLIYDRHITPAEITDQQTYFTSTYT